VKFKSVFGQPKHHQIARFFGQLKARNIYYKTQLKVCLNRAHKGLKKALKPLPQSTVGGDSAVDHGRGFECLMKTLMSSIKTNFELGFIVDITSFQLAQKSSNLVIFWLPKNALKFDWYNLLTLMG